jgi:DNA polymerase
MKHLHLDFETYCDLDLKKVGVHRYVEHTSFQVLCWGWRWEGLTEKARYNSRTPVYLPDEIRSADVQVHAWNAAFETAVLKRLGITPANPISCTMQRALAYGLPGRLDTAARALGLAAQKDMAGHRLMLKMSKPLKPGAPAWTAADYDALGAYCAQDAEAEAAISAVIPELQPEEARLSVLDAAMNTSGDLRVSVPRVRILMRVADAAERADAARCAKLTSGAVTSPGTQTQRLLEWLAAAGLDLPDVARATVEEALELTAVDPVIVEVLQIRLRMARASTRKLQRMLDMTGPICELRGQFQFCGAGRTGRWSGRGVQVQNLPRVPKGFSPDLFTDMAGTANITGVSLDAVAPAAVLDCVSWSLRSCLAASGGNMMWSFDFSQIEARVLAWLAGQQDVLDVFRKGDDVYVWAAKQFGSNDRQLGKVLILALGFGMGATKMRETAAKAYGVMLTMMQAEAFKMMWRQRNGQIVEFWYAMEHAAKAAILQRGAVAAVGGSGIAFQCTAKTLQMRLPSGRVLYYHKPFIDQDQNICYWGPEVGGQWIVQRTWGGKLAENATQAAARDVMSEAMLRVWDRWQRVPLMTVHDELVYEAGTAPDVLETTILEAPPWAGGLPIAGESKIMSRYGVAANTLNNP